jgi:glycosyltransferase involved in cell wall biosynthesis
MGRSDRLKRRKIAIIGTRGYPSYYGGFETAVRKLAPHLADHAWDVTVYGRPQSTRLNDPDLDRRVHSVTTWGVNNQSLSTLSFGFTSCLHAMIHKPDVALVMNVANGFWLPMLKLRRIPTVVNVDGIEWHRAKWGRVAKAMFRWGARFTAKFADHLVFDAKAIETFWKKEFDREGTFIPYGGEPVGELDVEPGLRAGEYVLMVARFVPENTIYEFFEAADKLAADGVTVVLVGSSGNNGDLDERARQLSTAHQSIHWLGHVSDDQRLFALWQHAGAYFHGHSVGGTNPALVQAMAAGAPVLARDTVYNREVLADTGVFCQPQPDDIVTSINALLRDPADLRSRAAERSRVHYNWIQVCADYEAVLRAESN